MTTFFILVLGSYFLMLIFFLMGWYQAMKQPVFSNKDQLYFTVLIPFRNEAKNLEQTIQSLIQVDYPENNFEVLFVNDHSEDESVELVTKAIAEVENFKMVHLKEEQEGKKMAITVGVEHALGAVIVTTDADCQVPTNWLNRINHAFASEDIKLVVGGVRMRETTTRFAKLQAMEMASLIGTGAATLGWGYLTMCNGANLAFRKSVFTKVGGFSGNFQIPSGDDEFLARKVDKMFPRAIRFLSATDSVVSTRPLKAVHPLIQQRLRWAGKWRYNKSGLSKILGVWIVLVQVSYVWLLYYLGAGKIDLLYGLGLVGLKWGLEGWFLYRVSVFLGSVWKWLLFVIMQFIYPFYVIGIGLLSQGKTFEWKGRRLSHKV